MVVGSIPNQAERNMRASSWGPFQGTVREQVRGGVVILLSPNPQDESGGITGVGNVDMGWGTGRKHS